MLRQLAFVWCLICRIPLPQCFHAHDRLPSSDALFLLPLAGLLVGVLNVLISHILLLGLPAHPSAWIATFIYILIGWGLHLDGWADFFDGLGSGKTHDEFLKIMKDSHCGAFGVMALTSIIGIRAMLLAALPLGYWTPALLMSASIGRLSICSAAYQGKYPWSSGMGREMVQGFTLRDLKKSICLSLLLAPLGVKHLILSITLSLIIGSIVANWANRRIGGVNGDVLGTCAVLSEVLILAIFFV